MEADNETRNKFFNYNKTTGLIKNTMNDLNKINTNFIITKGGEAGFSLTLPGYDKSQVMEIIINY